MITSNEIRLASFAEARCIAEMSRTLIESGLGWSWTPWRVTNEIRSIETNVIVATEGTDVIGFAIMKYYDQEARLNLFAVQPNYRRKGIGKQMVKWLEEVALLNGNGVIYLETRSSNKGAREFYQKLGYKVVHRIPGYYKGREAAIVMAHDLWSSACP
jgi:ribosomal-protein-alanine N-acetyltransferase